MRLLLPLLLTGCSFVFMQTPPARDPGVRPVPCTESRTLPAVDVLASVVLGVAALSLYADDQPTLFVLAAGSLAIGHGVAGAQGFAWASRCAAIKYSAPPPITTW